MRATVVSNLVIQGLTFGSSVLLARILGPQGRGELAIVLLYPQLIAAICMFGVDRAVAVRAGRGELPRPVATIATLSVIGASLAAVTAYGVVRWKVDDPRLAVLSTLYLAYIPPYFFYLLTALLFNGLGDFTRFNWVRLGFYAANLVLLALIWLTQPAPALSWTLAANLTAVYAAFLLALLMLRGVPTPAEGPVSLAPVLRMAAPFALPATLAHLWAVVHQVVLENRAGALELGTFVVLFSFSRLVAPLAGAVNSRVFHLGIRGAAHDIASLYRRSAVVFIVCATALAVLAPWVIPVVFGSGFEVSAAVMAPLALAAVLAQCADSMGEFLKGRALVGTETRALALALSVAVVLGWFLVPRWGLAGMAWALAAAETLRCTMLTARAAQVSQTPLAQFWRIGSRDLAQLLATARAWTRPSR